MRPHHSRGVSVGELELAKCRNWIIEPDPFSMNEALPNLCNKVMPLRDSVQFMPARGSDTQLRHVQQAVQESMKRVAFHIDRIEDDPHGMYSAVLCFSKQQHKCWTCRWRR
jgi:hypothetical protein